MIDEAGRCSNVRIVKWWRIYSSDRRSKRCTQNILVYCLG